MNGDLGITVDLASIFNWLTITGQIVGYLSFVPWFENLLAARPREDATVSDIHWLVNAHNPAARIYGMILYRLLHDMNIVVSSSDPYQRGLLDSAAHQFVTNLEGQGISDTEANHLAALVYTDRPTYTIPALPPALPMTADGTCPPGYFLNIAANACQLPGVLLDIRGNVVGYGPDFVPACPLGWTWDKVSGLCQPYPPAMLAEMPPGATINGPPAVLQTYNAGLKAADAQGLAGDARDAAATQYLLLHLPLDQLTAIRIGKPTPQTVPSNPDHTCPPGYVYDTASNLCVIPQTLPGPGGACNPGYSLDAVSGLCVWHPTKPPPPPPPVPPGGSGEGDELQQCCDETQAALANLATAIQQMQAGNTDAQCCVNIVTAISAVATAIAEASAKLGGPGPTPEPVDLSGVVKALQELAAAAAAWDTLATSIGAELGRGLTAIATAVGSSGGVDLKPIVDALNTSNTMADVPQAIINQLTAEGAWSPELGQLVSGAPLSHVLAAILGAIATWWGGASGTIRGGIGRVMINVVEPIGTLVWNTLVSQAHQFLAAFQTFALAGNSPMDALNLLARDLEHTLGKPGVTALEFVLAPAKALRNVQPGEQVDAARLSLARAWTMGELSHLLAMLAGLIPTTGFDRALEGFAAQVSLAAGFEEIAKAIHAVWYDTAFRQPARYEALSEIRPMVPDLGRALEMFSRRIISAAERDRLVQLAGMNPSWVDRINAVAYRPLSPFMLAGGFMDKDLDEPVLRSTMQYMGYRDQDIPLALQAIETRSLQQVRQAYIAEAMTAYGAGVVGDDELDSIFHDAGWGKAATSLAKKRALMMRRLTLAREVEQQVVTLVAAGAMDPDTGLHQLTAAGVQDWQAELKITLATTRAVVARAKAEAAAERRLELQRQRAGVGAAVAEYRAGRLDTAGLTAALVAAGVDPIIIPLTVATQEAIRAGRLKLVYGQLLPPDQAKLLVERVAALESQYKRGLIAEPTAAGQLAALGVDQPEIQALIARWSAEFTAPTTHGVGLPIR